MEKRQAITQISVGLSDFQELLYQWITQGRLKTKLQFNSFRSFISIWNFITSSHEMLRTRTTSCITFSFVLLGMLSHQALPEAPSSLLLLQTPSKAAPFFSTQLFIDCLLAQPTTLLAIQELFPRLYAPDEAYNAYLFAASLRFLQIQT